MDQARHLAHDPKRAFLVEMAQAWQKLADQAAATEKLQSAPVTHEPDRGD